MVTIVLPSSHRIESRTTLVCWDNIRCSAAAKHTPALEPRMPSSKYSSRSCLSLASSRHAHQLHLKTRSHGQANSCSLKHRRPVHVPVEVTSIILAHLDNRDLLQASLVSRLFHYECARILYRTIPRMSLKSSVQAICALARSAKLASLVRSYTITLKQGDPTGNLYRLLSTALSQMINLHSLSFEIPGNKSWIVQKCPANIRWFKTSLEFDDTLASWLATKPLVRDLILTRTKTFPMKPRELPNLSIIFGTPSTVLSAVIDRPVASVCFGLNGPVLLDLSNLAKTTVAVDHLGVAFDPIPDREELNCLDFVYRSSMYLPRIQKLSLFATRSTFSPTFYRLVAPLLSRFCSLKCLQFVLGESGVVLPMDRPTQLELLQEFHCCNPTLRNVTFPGNLTWNIE